MIALVLPHEAHIYPVVDAKRLQPGTDATDAVPLATDVLTQDQQLLIHGYARSGPWEQRQGFAWCRVEAL